LLEGEFRAFADLGFLLLVAIKEMGFAGEVFSERYMVK